MNYKYLVFPFGRTDIRKEVIRPNNKYLVYSCRDMSIEICSGVMIIDYVKNCMNSPDDINIRVVVETFFLIGEYEKDLVCITQDKFVFIVKNGSAYAWYNGVGVIDNRGNAYKLGVSPTRLFRLKSIYISDGTLVKGFSCGYNDFMRRVILELGGL